MKSIFLSIAGIVLIGSIFTSDLVAKNPYKLSQAEIAEIINSLNNELSVKDIPVLQDKIVVFDESWNVLLEQPLQEVLEKDPSSKERSLIKKSEFLMEYAGNSYYMLED
ncbi:hypothetical protein [uncultured Imperialibacter sp.]|uniref:hypothetical protein n=1 Tax=uncultured Imperialibacter sp. TaxID=1672639 RepID=UPI0030D9409F